MTEAKTKKCSTCKLVKPLSDFYKNRSSLDKHHNLCKVCCAEAQRTRRSRKKRKPARYGSVELLKPGIITWEQVDCVLRQIAESENAIKDYRAERTRKILEIINSIDGCIERLKERQEDMFQLLDGFVIERYSGRALVVKKLNYGRVRIVNGEIEVDPNYKLARKTAGKP